MKIRWSIALLAALSAALMLVACGPADLPDTSDTTAAPVAEQTEPTAPPAVYGFTVSDTLLYAGADPAVLTALGQPQDLLEAPSCTHAGMDRVYYYAGFEVNTQPTAAGGEVIVSVYLTDDSVTTPEGLYIGATLDAVKAAYGEPAKQADGLCSYAKTDGGVTGQVNFVIGADGTVTSIYYN